MLPRREWALAEREAGFKYDPSSPIRCSQSLACRRNQRKSSECISNPSVDEYSLTIWASDRVELYHNRASVRESACLNCRDLPIPVHQNEAILPKEDDRKINTAMLNFLRGASEHLARPGRDAPFRRSSRS